MKRTTKATRIGPYRLVESVGQGTMGEVFLAWHPELQRTVAIKVLKRTVSYEKSSVLERFRREGRIIAQMDHPGIARVFDLGSDAGLHYIVMEYIRGRDLQRILRDEGTFTPERALAIARQVAEALDHAHGFGIVHRDVKPSNIIVAEDGTARLTDFGVARLMGQETVLTRAGELIGSPAFMSPEQVRGADNVDARSDLYSLGATLYVLLSGKLPFSADTLPGTMHKIVHSNPSPLETLVPGLSPPAAGLVRRSMAKLPAARFQTGMQFREAVDEVLRRGLTHAPQDRRDRTAASRTTLPWRAVAVSIGICVIVGALLYDASDPREASAGSSVAARVDLDGAPPLGESSDDDGESHAEGPFGTDERARLEKRLLEFRDALLSGSGTQALDLVEPSVRSNPGLLTSLQSIVESIAAMGSAVSVQHTVEMREEGASVVFFIQPEGSSRIMKLPVKWVRRNDDWYAAPKGDDPDS